jgi:KUP system potassium uptake protein
MGGYNPFAVAAVNGFFLAVDLIFVAANSAKLFEGGWFPFYSPASWLSDADLANR